MNYLAHFHLAEQLARRSGLDEPGLLVGALLGDYVKGPLRGHLPTSWETGIWLHRRIDAVTDRHPRVQRCLAEFPGDYRRFGGIMLDVCFDHCLSRNWPDYDPRPLADFNRQCYQTLLARDANFPRAARQQIRFLAEHNILDIVRDWQNVEIMLERIGRRLKVANPLSRCGPMLKAQLPTIEPEFASLYRELHDQLAGELAARTEISPLSSEQ